jgi:hypothetical protein
MAENSTAASDFDVVVVGTGIAGMSAALQAADAGASVLLVDSGTVLGGSSRHSNGIMMAGGTSLQREAGLTDSPDDLFDEYMLANQWNVVPSLVRRMVDELPVAFEWARHLGVQFAPDLIPAGEERVPRGHAVIGQGQGFVDVLASHVKKSANIEIAMAQRVDRLVVEDGRVVGVATGDDVVRAAAVVLATGGFGGNPDFYDPYLPLAAENDATWYIAGEVPTAGDIFGLVEPVDAYIDGYDRGAWVLCADFNHEPQAYLPGWLVIVNRSGRRFMDEMSPYSVVDPIVRGQGNRVFAIFDHAAKTSATAENIKAATKVNLEGVVRSHWLEEVLDEQIEAGEVKVGETLEELAEKLGIEPGNLAGTVARYNQDAHDGVDELFMKDPTQMVPLEQGPFYGCEMRLSLLALTACGPAIDAEARVLNGGQAPVPGLFAAGECTSGVIGSLYIGSGNSISNCLAFGRIAGRNAAALAAAGATLAAVGA